MLALSIAIAAIILVAVPQWQRLKWLFPGSEVIVRKVPYFHPPMLPKDLQR
jgi:hypothetical protein